MTPEEAQMVAARDRGWAAVESHIETLTRIAETGNIDMGTDALAIECAVCVLMGLYYDRRAELQRDME